MAQCPIGGNQDERRDYLNTAARTACRVLADQSTADTSVVNAVVVATCPVALSAPPTVAVTSIDVSGTTCSPGTAQAPTNRAPGNVMTVYLRAPYWPFTRIVDLSALGGSIELRAPYSFAIQASGR